MNQLTLVEAQQAVEQASRELYAAQQKLFAAHVQLKAAEERVAADNFVPNATMVLKLETFSGPMMDMTSEVSLEEGQRVQAKPGKFTGGPWVVTRQDGKSFDLKPSYFKLDEEKNNE